MLTELKGKGGCLCQPAKQGQLRCPLIVRPTSEDVITGHVFQALKAINARHWLPQLLNAALGANRFRQQCFRRLRIELWCNQQPYPPGLLPWKEGSTQVDGVIEWENPPTTVFIEAKFKSELSSRTEGNDGQYGFPSDQLTRNIRVGLHRTGYFHEPRLFGLLPRDFAMIVFSPFGSYDLVNKYQDSNRLRTSIPHGEHFRTLPKSPFIGQLSYAAMIGVLRRSQCWLTRPERLLTCDLIEYLQFKFAMVTDVEHSKRQLDFSANTQMDCCGIGYQQRTEVRDDSGIQKSSHDCT